MPRKEGDYVDDFGGVVACADDADGGVVDGDGGDGGDGDVGFDRVKFGDDDDLGDDGDGDDGGNNGDGRVVNGNRGVQD